MELKPEPIRAWRGKCVYRIERDERTGQNEHDASALGTELTRELIGIERKFIHSLLRDGKITDETRRRIELDLDLEEASLANREYRTLPL